jgi:hypothetical protein
VTAIFVPTEYVKEELEEGTQDKPRPNHVYSNLLHQLPRCCLLAVQLAHAVVTWLQFYDADYMCSVMKASHVVQSFVVLHMHVAALQVSPPSSGLQRALFVLGLILSWMLCYDASTDPSTMGAIVAGASRSCLHTS